MPEGDDKDQMVVGDVQGEGPFINGNMECLLVFRRLRSLSVVISTLMNAGRVLFKILLRRAREVSDV